MTEEEFNYKYKSPTEYGYKKFKISRKEIHKIMGREYLTIFAKTEAYYSKKSIRFEFTTNVLGKVVSILALPLTIVLYGYREAIENTRNCFREKEKGKFLSEYISKNSDKDKYIKLEEIYKRGSDRNAL